jgi:hypothetical protein
MSVNSQDISLNAEQWESSHGTIIKNKGDSLTAKSIENTIWLSPVEMIPVVKNSTATLDYSLRSGNLIIQADWFDAEGSYLQTTDLDHSTAESTQVKFSINTTLASQASYRLKLWAEADMPNLRIDSLKISQETPVKKTTLLSKNDFEPTETISITVQPDGALQMGLLNSHTTGTLLTLKHFDISKQGNLHFNLLNISESSSCSIQLLLWDIDGTYLGYIDALKDATDTSSSKVQLNASKLPEGSMSYSLKFWLSGHPNTMAMIQIEQE